MIWFQYWGEMFDYLLEELKWDAFLDQAAIEWMIRLGSRRHTASHWDMNI